MENSKIKAGRFNWFHLVLAFLLGAALTFLVIQLLNYGGISPMFQGRLPDFNKVPLTGIQAAPLTGGKL